MPQLSAPPGATLRSSLVTREEEIFAAALLLPGAARQEYVAQACGDDLELRDNVEALLEAHASAEHFLAGSPADAVLAEVEPHAGDRIGPYVIIQKIGEGGCGLVFLAEQEHPIRRRVALKVIKPGMDSRQVIARFEAERQALAQMEHPDIARVFEAGATPQGRPYFAMEYIDGLPITRFCDEAALSLAARLELFERICLALQHAHQKGIVHRDVKPSNVLVALHEGRPVPKIIDFGIAKATQARLTDATQLTGFEQFLGTPAYMSPEQAERRDLDIDTRSDIYSLGVLLYELLTGQPPFDPKSLVRAGVDEIRRIIREVDPPRPSTALSTLGVGERTTVARQRAAAPERLSSVLRGDLDWIVMHCMEKDRTRRYGTANELAEDIRRHLRSEPVTARPPSKVYRARKFVRRHRVACAAVTAVALSLVLGVIVSVAQAVRASRAEQDARRRQGDAEDMMTFMLGDFRDDLKKVGQLPLLEKVGIKAQVYFAAADPRDLTDAALARHAKALTQIGEVKLLQKDVRYAEAEQAFVAAYRSSAELVARHPGDGNMLFERAQAEYWIGFTHLKRGEWSQTGEWFKRYRDSAIALGAIDRTNVRWQREVVAGYHNLAALDFNRGDYGPAREGFLAEMAALQKLSADNPADRRFQFRITDVDSWLGSVAERNGDFTEARARFGAETAGLDQLVQAEPDNTEWRFKLADSLSWEAEIELVTGKLDVARARLARSASIFSTLLNRDPANRRWSVTFLALRLRGAALETAEGNLDLAERIMAEVLPKLEALVAAEPQDRNLSLRLLTGLRLEAALRLTKGRSDAADVASRAQTLGATFARETRADDDMLGEYAQACVVAGRIAATAGLAEEAARHWSAAVDLLGPKLAGSRYWRLLDPAARALASLGRLSESQALVERLQKCGYQPIEPWSIPGAPNSLVRNNNNSPTKK